MMGYHNIRIATRNDTLVANISILSFKALYPNPKRAGTLVDSDTKQPVPLKADQHHSN